MFKTLYSVTGLTLMEIPTCEKGIVGTYVGLMYTCESMIKTLGHNDSKAITTQNDVTQICLH